MATEKLGFPQEIAAEISRLSKKHKIKLYAEYCQCGVLSISREPLFKNEFCWKCNPKPIPKIYLSIIISIIIILLVIWTQN